MFSKLSNTIVFLIIGVVTTLVGNAQQVFTISEQGLQPKQLDLQIASGDAAQLYDMALKWLRANENSLNVTIDSTSKNQSILINMVKGNGVSLDKQYFNIKYAISFSFSDKELAMEPKSIQLKLNSKYDMGWKDFEMDETAQYFKKGKPIRKYKSYLKGITTPLNDLFTQLQEALK